MKLRELVSARVPSIFPQRQAAMMRFGLFLLLPMVALFGCSGPKTAENVSSSANPILAKESRELKQVAVKVTGMMCPHACYPEVESLIGKQKEVDSIELTPQKEKDKIDNPVVLVKFHGELDKAAITRSLMGAGFTAVEYIDP